MDYGLLDIHSVCDHKLSSSYSKRLSGSMQFIGCPRPRVLMQSSFWLPNTSGSTTIPVLWTLCNCGFVEQEFSTFSVSAAQILDYYWIISVI